MNIPLRTKRKIPGSPTAFTLAVAVMLLPIGLETFAQKGRSRGASQTSHSSNVLSPEAREMIELASGAVCKERIIDPKGSVPIDEMQARPSLSVQSPEALAGIKRAQRLLPVTRNLVIESLRQLSKDYNLNRSRGHAYRIQRAIARVSAVKFIKPDVDSRDNASVFLQNPRTIIFGTIFLAGLPSDEGIVSVLSHE